MLPILTMTTELRRDTGTRTVKAIGQGRDTDIRDVKAIGTFWSHWPTVNTYTVDVGRSPRRSQRREPCGDVWER